MRFSNPTSGHTSKENKISILKRSWALMLLRIIHNSEGLETM